CLWLHSLGRLYTFQASDTPPAFRILARLRIHHRSDQFDLQHAVYHSALNNVKIFRSNGLTTACGFLRSPAQGAALNTSAKILGASGCDYRLADPIDPARPAPQRL